MEKKTKRTNYLNKKDMLRFIHESKASYTWYIDSPTYHNSKYLHYDIILCWSDLYDEARHQLMLQLINMKRRDLLLPRTSIMRDEDIPMLTEEDYEHIDSRVIEFNGEFTDLILEKAKLGHYNRKQYAEGKKRVAELPDDIEIEAEDLVLRVMTFQHIPKNEVETGKEKKVADHHIRCNFPPYIHYGYYEGKLQVVARSHRDKNDKFSLVAGNITDELAHAYLLQSRRVSYKHNTKGYSYIDDMVSHANVQLVQVGLQFNEMFSDNPFAYFTTIITNSFKTVLKDEKRIRDHRDQVLLESDYSPSITMQIEIEQSRDEHWNKVLGRGENAFPEATYRDYYNNNAVSSDSADYEDSGDEYESDVDKVFVSYSEAHKDSDSEYSDDEEENDYDYDEEED